MGLSGVWESISIMFYYIHIICYTLLNPKMVQNIYILTQVQYAQLIAKIVHWAK